MPEKTHWKKLNNPDYLGAYAFNPGEEKTVTISAIKREIVTGPDGKKEECTVVSFAGNTKPLILNATNAKMVQNFSKLHTSRTGPANQSPWLWKQSAPLGNG